MSFSLKFICTHEDFGFRYSVLRYVRIPKVLYNLLYLSPSNGISVAGTSMINRQRMRVGVVSCGYQYVSNDNIDWNGVSNEFRLRVDFLNDAQPHKHVVSSSGSNTVNPTGERLTIACIDDGGSNNRDSKVSSTHFDQSLAYGFGVGVGVGIFS